MDNVLLSQGRTAEVFDLGDCVLKLFRADFPRQAAAEEIQLMKMLQAHDLPLPRFYGATEQEGRPGLILEKIDGRPMTAVILAKPWALAHFAGKMAAIHAAIHRVKIVGLARQKDRLVYLIDVVPELTPDQKDRILTVLAGLDEGDALCHGDLHPENIMCSATGEATVIDWMTAAAGSPAGDAARTILILKYSKVPAHLPRIARIAASLSKAQLARIYLRSYLRITGIDRRSVAAWELPLAAARLAENCLPEEKEVLLGLIDKRLRKRT